MGGILVAFLPTYLVAEGNSLLFGGAGLAVLELSGAIGALLGGTISDKIGRKKYSFDSYTVLINFNACSYLCSKVGDNACSCIVRMHLIFYNSC